MKFLALTAAFVLFILYASFYPFQFAARPELPVAHLLSTWRAGTSRSDYTSNVILYLPLGFCIAHLSRRGPRLLLLPLAALAGAICSLFVELGQFYDASRVSSLADVYANTAGAFLGACAAVVLARRTRALASASLTSNYFVVLLLGAWLGYRLFPYIPTIDLYQYKAAIKPLIFSPKFSGLDFYRHWATSLAVAALIADLIGATRARFLAPLALLAVIGVRITISGVLLSPAEVLGTLTAVVCWIVLPPRQSLRVPLAAAAVIVLIVLQSLAPFHFLSAARPFGWTPFRSFFHGSTAVNVLSMFEKILMYGALVWLLHRSGLRLAIAATAATIFVFGLRLFQVYLPGRSAEITDAVMVILLAAVMALLRPASPKPEC